MTMSNARLCACTIACRFISVEKESKSRLSEKAGGSEVLGLISTQATGIMKIFIWKFISKKITKF